MGNKKSKNEKVNVKNKKENKKKNKKPSKHPKLKKAIKIILIILLLLIIIGAGIIAGLFLGWFGGEFKITKDDLIIEYSNTKVVDSSGNLIAELSAKEKRQIVDMSEMSKYLPMAFVSIEDERFYEHQGVDIKRSLAATVSFLFNKGSSSFGGSTITQQLIKNITNQKDDEGIAGVKRKIGEMTKAYQVEKILSKDQILEMYLNIIFLGEQNYGVQTASIYYFNKNASDLTLAESAFLAGITHSPNVYNPYTEEDKTEKIKTRTNTVLNKMLELNKITNEEYEQAKAEVDAGLVFTKGTIADKSSYSYHTDAMLKQIVNQLIEEKGMDKEYAETYLYGGGFTIYSTEDPEIQKIAEEEHNKSTYIKKSNKIEGATTQAATVIIDQKTGNVVALVGGLGEKVTGGWNRAIDYKRQTGSSMKPIAVIAPSLESGLINAGTVVDDVPIPAFGNHYKNYYGGYKGLSNIRYMLKISQNTTEAQLLQKLTPANSIEFLRKLGITSLVTASENATKNDENLSLALGGITFGVTPLEMAAAYATIANNGTYIEPTLYTKIVDSEEKTILEPNQETHRVLAEGNAFIMQSLLKEPIGAGGTGTAAAISGMDVCGKTGTTNDDFDGWFCGFTPYYTGATWYGYDINEKVTSSTATRIWAGIMKQVHKDLKGARFEKTSDITTANICKDSGLLATDLCSKDPRGSRVYTEYFVKGTAPSKSCTTHVEAEIDTDNGKIATEFCPNKEKRVFITRPNSESNTGWKSAEDAQYMLPTENCEEHKEGQKDTEKPVITLKGKAEITLKLNEKYTEEGATANDNVDGDISKDIKIEGKVDTSKEGTYTVTYTVEDKAKNKATVTRKVIVTSGKTNNSNTNTNTNKTNTETNATNTTNTNNTNNTAKVNNTTT